MNDTVEASHVQYLDTAAALKYLRKRYPQLRADTFYHRVHRGQIPCKKENGRYFFCPDDLDHVHFRGGERPEPMLVRSDADLRVLRRRYDGPIVDLQGLLSEIWKQHGIHYSPAAVKQRRLRGTLLVVGYSGNRRKNYWYAASQVPHMHFQHHQEQGET